MSFEAKPAQATCAVCLARKHCVTERNLRSGEAKCYDNFFYSEDHKGWLCRKCAKKLEKSPEAASDLVDYINAR